MRCKEVPALGRYGCRWSGGASGSAAAAVLYRGTADLELVVVGE
jgi:hypothetical protein